jgi:hypothetical protein
MKTLVDTNILLDILLEGSRTYFPNLRLAG